MTAEGPLVQSAVTQGDSVVVSFSSADGLTTSDGKPLRGFQLVDKEGNFLPAKAMIRGKKVFLAVPSKTVIDRVVYAWKPFTRANLVNKAGLPASTFMMTVNETGRTEEMEFTRNITGRTR